MQLFCPCVVERTATTTIKASRDDVLRFLREDPERYLDIAKLRIEKLIQRNEGFGQWLVSEDLGIPLLPRTNFTITWTEQANGATWVSQAPLKVHVVNTFTVHDGSEGPTFESAMPSSSQRAPSTHALTMLTEQARLQCPAAILPLVRYSFERAHRRLLEAIRMQLG